MTFEEMHNISQDMLVVQRELQSGHRELQAGQRELQESQRETQSMVQALSRDVMQMVTTHQESMQNIEDLMQRLGEVQIGMARWVTSIDETQPTILARLMRIENKVDNLLDRDQPQ